MIRETRQVRRGGRRNDDTHPRFLFRNRRTHILWLQAPSKLSRHGFDAHNPSPSRQWPKPAKTLVSPPIHPRLGQLPRHPHLPRIFESPTVQWVERTASNPTCLGRGCGWGGVLNGHVGTMKTAGPAIRALLSIVWTRLSTMAAWPLLLKRQRWFLKTTKLWKDNDTLPAPTSFTGSDVFHRKLRREVAKEGGVEIK